MKAPQETEIAQILELQAQIAERLKELGFVGDPDATGNISHHLAESVVFARKLSSEILPAFLNRSTDQRKGIGELIVDLQYELSELSGSLEDMEPALVKLMNFLTG
jgi:hypothetical protein